MIKNTHPRRIAREAVLQALYASEITGEDSDKILFIFDLLDKLNLANLIYKCILILFTSNIFGIKFAVRVTSKPTGQEAVSRRSTNRATDIGASELHSFHCHAIEIRSVGVTPEGSDAGWILIIDQKHDDVRAFCASSGGNHCQPAEERK